MDVNSKIKEELEARVKRLEDFIENKGFGSTRLKKARKMQRNVNVAVFMTSIIAVAGISIWALSNNKD